MTGAANQLSCELGSNPALPLPVLMSQNKVSMSLAISSPEAKWKLTVLVLCTSEGYCEQQGKAGQKPHPQLSLNLLKDFGKRSILIQKSITQYSLCILLLIKNIVFITFGKYIQTQYLNFILSELIRISHTCTCPILCLE